MAGVRKRLRAAGQIPAQEITAVHKPFDDFE
jgi:hypothetical protein